MSPVTRLGTHHTCRRLRGRTYRHVIHSAPVRFRDERGRLRSIATHWQDGGEDRPHLVTAAPFWLSITNGGEARYHPTRDPSVWFEVGDPRYRSGGDVHQYDLGIPSRNNNRLTWQTQHLRMDAIHAGHFGKLGMLFKTDAYQSVDDREIAFPIAYHGCTRQGRNVLVAGLPVMRLRPFRAYDHNDPLHDAPVTHEWRTYQGQEYIVVTLPLAMDEWDQPVLDPTWERPQADFAGVSNYLDKDDPNDNGTAGGTYINGRYTTLTKFIFTSIPSAATITAVTYQLYQYAGSAGDNTFRIARILAANDGWDENACWNTKDGSNAWAGSAGARTSGTDFSSTPLWSGLPDDSDDTWISFTLDTTEFQLLRANNYGIIHRADTLTANPYRFYRGPGYETASLRPKLTVTYTLPATADTNPAMTRRMRL